MLIYLNSLPGRVAVASIVDISFNALVLVFSRHQLGWRDDREVTFAGRVSLKNPHVPAVTQMSSNCRSGTPTAHDRLNACASSVREFDRQMETLEAIREPGAAHPATGRSRSRILVVEDDFEMAAFLRKGLEESGYWVEWMADGLAGLAAAREGCFDAIILDRMLPSIDGLSLLEALRGEGHDAPVVFLSAIGTADERVRGLRAGSDDYLVKPFEMTELIARLEVIHRRKTASPSVVTRLACADLSLDLLAWRAVRAGRPLLLQPRAIQLLEFLMRNHGQVVTRSMILQKVWNYDFDPGTNVIDVYISNLRKEVDRPGLEPLLHTVRGKGYRLGPAA